MAWERLLRLLYRSLQARYSLTRFSCRINTAANMTTFGCWRGISYSKQALDNELIEWLILKGYYSKEVFRTSQNYIVGSVRVEHRVIDLFNTSRSRIETGLSTGFSPELYMDKLCIRDVMQAITPNKVTTTGSSRYHWVIHQELPYRYL